MQTRCHRLSVLVCWYSCYSLSSRSVCLKVLAVGDTYFWQNGSGRWLLRYCIYFSWYEGDLWDFLWKASRFCMSLMIDFVNHGWFFSYAVHFVVHIISRNCFSHLAQEVLMSSPIRMESTSIWESSSFANSKSAWLYCHIDQGCQGGRWVARVLMLARISLWSDVQSGGIMSQLFMGDGFEDDMTSVVVAMVSVVRV